MDKVTFDFEKEEILIEEGEHVMHEHLPGLMERKAKILSAGGVLRMSLSLNAMDIEQLSKGTVDLNELSQKVMEIIEDSLKSSHPEDLN